jgi:transposase
VKEELVYLGVDIAKSHLDAAMGAQKHRFSNDTVGHRQLVRWIEQTEAAVQVICESSGGYERRLVQALAGARIKVSLVQANRVSAICAGGGNLG